MKPIDRVVLGAAAFAVIFVILVSVEALWKWLGANHNQLVVIFTAGIFVFTLALALYTKALWRSTGALVRESMLANAPFLVPVPLVAERFAGEDSRHTDQRRARIAYGFENHGKTPAIIRRFRDFTLFTDRLPEQPTFTERWDARAFEYIPIGIGERGGVLEARVPAGMSGEEVARRLGADGHRLYVIGEVEYADPANFIRVQRYCIQVHNFLEMQAPDTPPRIVPVFMRAGGQPYNLLTEGAAHD